MYFFYGTESLTKTAQRPTLLPFRLTIYAIAVQFEHLHKIRSPVEETCGFSLKEFDRVILVREKWSACYCYLLWLLHPIFFVLKEASKQSDGFMEPHPLWEYPSYPVTDVHEVFRFDFHKQGLEADIANEIAMPIKSDGVLNGVALWSKIEYDEEDKSLRLVIFIVLASLHLFIRLTSLLVGLI